MRTPTKKEIYIIASGFVLLSLFLILFFVCPALAGIIKESGNLISQRNEMASLEEEFSEAAGFEKKYSDYKPNLEKIDSLFIYYENPVEFIEFLEKTASDFDLALDISTPSAKKEGGLYFTDFQLSVAGEFSGILKFTESLENGEYLIKIQNLNITANKNTAENRELKASMLIRVLSNEYETK